MLAVLIIMTLLVGTFFGIALACVVAVFYDKHNSKKGYQMKHLHPSSPEYQFNKMVDDLLNE